MIILHSFKFLKSQKGSAMGNTGRYTSFYGLDCSLVVFSSVFTTDGFHVKTMIFCLFVLWFIIANPASFLPLGDRTCQRRFAVRINRFVWHVLKKRAHTILFLSAVMPDPWLTQSSDCHFSPRTSLHSTKASSSIFDDKYIGPVLEITTPQT